MADFNDFYTMIGTITNIWLSIIVSLTMIFIAQAIDKKTSYLNALSKEKISINSSFENISNDLENIDSSRVGFSRKSTNSLIPDDYLLKCQDNYFIALETTCGQIDKVEKNENISAINLDKESLVNNIDEGKQIKPEEAIELIIGNIIYSIFKIIQCYPSQGELGKEFIDGTRTLMYDHDYLLWTAIYEKYISFMYIDKCFIKFEQYLTCVNTELDEINILKVTRIKNVIDNLRSIHLSLHEIEIQNFNFKPITDIFNLRKKFFYGVGGLILFGFILPAYMLLPCEYHFNRINELYILAMIIVGLLFLWLYTLSVLWRIIKLILRE